MSYDSSDPFGQFLKRYFYLFSFNEGKINHEEIKLVFDKLVKQLSELHEGLDYGYCTFVNESLTTETTTVHDLYISYNPKFRVDEATLKQLIRSELMQFK